MLVAALGAFAFAPAGSPASPSQPAEGQIIDQTTTYACNVNNFLRGTQHMDCGGGVAEAEDQTALSLYQAGIQTDAGNNQYFDLLNNQLETSKEVAWMRAERAVARAAVNGTTESAANVDATEALNSYYTIHERNFLDKWNMYLTGLEAYESQSSNVSYDMFDLNYFDLNTYKQVDTHTVSLDSYQIVGFQNTTHTLPDGSTMTLRTLQVEIAGSNYYESGSSFNDQASKTISITPKTADERVTLEWQNSEDYDFSVSLKPTSIHLEPPNEDYDARNYLSFGRQRDHWDSISQQQVEMKNNTDTFVSNVYPAFQSGEVSPEDMVSRVNKMFNYAADGGENATYNEAFVALAAMGLDPAGNSSYLSLTYERDGLSGNVTNDGMLLSNTAPNGSWAVGHTYESGNISGPQMVVTLDGDQHTINGSFRINGAYRDDGTEISDPTLEAPENSYAVSNTTEAQRLVTMLSEKINRFHNRTTTTAGGGGGVDGVGGLGGLFSGIGSFFGGFANSVAGFLGIPIRQVVIVGGVLVLAVVVLR